MTNDDERIFACNGIDGKTGESFYPPASLAEMEALARGLRPDPQKTAAMIYQRQKQSNPRALGMARDGIEPMDLGSSGWGAVFPQQVDPAIREALTPLLKHRKRLATKRSGHFFREVDYQGESKNKFLSRFGVGPGPVDPNQLPYYLLLVGGPEKIPWSFQHQLAVKYAVGRLSFETAEEYASYAETVIAAETGRLARPRRIVLFGTNHDHATEMMTEHLIGPLRAALSSYPTETILAGEATKERLARLLGGDETPALLFTALHGMGFPADDPQQLARQGALLCQSCTAHGPIGPDAYLAGEDVADSAPPAGLIAFFYACHGAGTPQFDIYQQQAISGVPVSTGTPPPRRLAEKPFVASLPRRLLGHPAGGALAVIGHVERTWGYSFIWKDAGSQTIVFEDCLKRLLKGFPVGAALEPFTFRLGEIATDLANLHNQIGCGEPVDPKELVSTWTAYHDAQTYVLLGDPAVRLPAAEVSPW